MKLETLIEQNYHKLNQSDLIIWDYLRSHMESCKQMNIDQLADACHISHTSVLRFAKKLGLKGFSELKVILKWQQPVNEGFGSDELEKAMQDYQQTLEYLYTVNFSDLFALWDRAEKIYVYGSGNVQQYAARDLRRNFFVVNKLLHTIEGEDELCRIASHIHENDIMLFISLSGNNAFINRMAEQLKRQGRTIVSITRVQSNRLIHLSDINIPFFTHCVQTGAEFEFWLTSQMFMINEFLILKYLAYRAQKDQRPAEIPEPPPRP